MKKIFGILAAGLFLNCASANNEEGFPIETITDAGSSYNYPGDACAKNNVWYNGGTIFTSPRIHLVFWGDWWQQEGITDFNRIADAWIVLANDPAFYSPVSEYGVGTGTLVGTFNTNPNMAVGQITEKDAQLELQNEISQGFLPANKPNSVYIIVLPQGSPSFGDVIGGHHGSVDGISYALIDYNSNLSFMSLVISHEIYECATDPYYNGIRGTAGKESEIADLCQGDIYTLDYNFIQGVWSEQNCMCIPVISDN